MPAGTLTYSLATALNEVNRLIEENEVSVFSDFMDQCFDVFFTDDCAELVVSDKTDYTDVDTNNLTMTIQVIKKPNYSLEIVVVASTPFTPGSTVRFGESDGISGDGEYCVVINSSYEVGLDTYENEVEVCKTLNCCASKICNLISSIECKMAQVGCLIKDNIRMGKEVSRWNTQLFKLTLMLNLLQNCCSGCDDYERVLCEFNGMKNVNY